jgi:hypothetical protein
MSHDKNGERDEDRVIRSGRDFELLTWGHPVVADHPGTEKRSGSDVAAETLERIKQAEPKPATGRSSRSSQVA